MSGRGEWDGLVVVCAGAMWDANRLGAQHIAEQLSRYRPVLYVDPPISVVGVLRRRWLGRTILEPRLRVIGPRLARLTPVVTPGKTRVGGRALAGAVLRRHLRRAVRSLGAEVDVVIAIPPHFPVFGTLGERLRVHIASDDFVAGARLNGVSTSWVEGRERAIAAEADVVVAVSTQLVDRWRRLGHEPVFMPNGCDYELFATTPTVARSPEVTLPEPIAAFIGTLSDRTDIGLLAAVAATGVSLLLVGPRSHTSPQPELDRILALPNVQWVGAKPYTEVPSYLAHASVGLVPYTRSEFNRASFPLKVLDYLAAGLPVVASDLPAVRWISEQLIDVTVSTDEFVDRTLQSLRTAGDEAARAARQGLAAGHTWERRVADLAQAIGLVERGSGTGGAPR